MAFSDHIDFTSAGFCSRNDNEVNNLLSEFGHNILMMKHKVTPRYYGNTNKGLHLNLLIKNKEGRWTRILYTILHIDNLVSAYENIQANPGLMTHAITRETISGISKERLAHISCALLKGTFDFSPMRRIFVPKPKSKDTRPITISSPIDRVVHRSVANALEQIFEHLFLPVSYGFRPSASTHSFFAEVCKWTGIKRIIHADVKKCFDNIEHSTLIHLLEKHIADPLFLELLMKFLSTPILDDKGQNESSTGKGIPQGAVFSPLLMNVVLHELDGVALSICKEKGLTYGRYADDCTIGTGVNSDSLARDTLNPLSQFMKTELGGLYFKVKMIKKAGCILGAHLVLPRGDKKGGNLTLKVPMDRVIYRLTQKGFLKPSQKFVLGLGKNPVAISYRYKMVALGLIRYYLPCDNLGKNLISLLKRDLFHSLCQAIGMLTGILPRDVPKRLPGAVSIYRHGIRAGIDLIRKNTPSPCVQLRKKDIRQKERVGESEEGKVNSILFRPCACKKCQETGVRIFQVRKMKDYLKIMGGLVVKTKGQYFGGVSALRKVLSQKRLPLCATHFQMMEKGKLRFSNLSVTATCQSYKLMKNDQEFFELKEKPRKSRRK